MIAKEEKYILIMKYDYHYNVQLAKQDESDDVTSKDWHAKETEMKIFCKYSFEMLCTNKHTIKIHFPSMFVWDWANNTQTHTNISSKHFGKLCQTGTYCKLMVRQFIVQSRRLLYYWCNDFFYIIAITVITVEFLIANTIYFYGRSVYVIASAPLYEVYVCVTRNMMITTDIAIQTSTTFIVYQNSIYYVSQCQI